jgi:TolB-like protein
MKRCQKCGANYSDETLNFCLEDGEWLVKNNEPATVVLPTSAGHSEAATRVQSNATDADGDRLTAVLNSRQAGPRSDDLQSTPTQGFDKRLLLAPVMLAVIVLAGFAGYRYFKPAGEQINSIAVLSFQNRSDDPDTEYLSDGLAESLIFRLSQVPGLKVSPTSSVMRYKGTQTDVAKIAKELGVDAVMSGRLTKRGENLNIGVELVDARGEKVLWAEQYDRKMSDLLATQREIASTIVQKLQLKLTGNNDRGVTKRYTDNNEAYQLWMKGRYHFAKRTKEDLHKSIEIFEEAVKLDPKFALSYVGMAESWTVIPSFPYGSPADCVPKAKAAVAKALELDPDLPEAHTVSAMIAATYDWDWAKAEAGFKRALELDPNLSITHYRYAWTFLSPMGRHDEAVAEMRIAMEKEPLYLIQGANFAGVLMYARRFDEAVDQAKKTFDLDPNFIGGKNWLSHTYNIRGKYDESLAIAEKSLDSEMPFLSDAAYAYAKTGQREKALVMIERWKEAEKKRYVMNYWVAVAYAALGDKDGAFAELEKAYKNRDWFLQRIKVDPFMDPLRDDPRFDEMVKRIGL